MAVNEMPQDPGNLAVGAVNPRNPDQKGAPIRAILALGDLLAIIVASLAAYGIMQLSFNTFGYGYVSFARLIDERGTALISASLIACGYFLFSGHYHMRMPFWAETRSVTSAAALGLVMEGFLVFANKADVSRSSMFLSWIVAPFAIMWGRHLLRRVLAVRGSGRHRAVVFGRSAETARVSDILSSDFHLGFDICGTDVGRDIKRAVEAMDAARATDAVIALSCADDTEISLATELRKRGYSICLVPPPMGMSSGIDVRYIMGRDAMLLVSRPEATPRLNRAAKRLFDVMVSSILLFILGVPMALVAAAISLDGGAPIFGHVRIGKGGKPFRCLKFRSMRSDAEDRLNEYLATSEEARIAWNTTRKLPSDPRITTIGRFIRKTSIDELPQLVNVLKGDMSLVGPRPVTEPELANYGNSRELYTAVMPGLTGLWQVSGRSDLSYARRVALDTWYVENWSPWHDIAILSKTVPVVLGRGGAY